MAGGWRLAAGDSADYGNRELGTGNRGPLPGRPRFLAALGM